MSVPNVGVEAAYIVGPSTGTRPVDSSDPPTIEVTMTDDHDLPREGLVPDSSGVELRCPACGETFPRSRAATPKKGQLACPSCGETGIEEGG
jgi:predicted RNA-binding Zn-ribbon protein involved in translation (DUF1610 family)